MTNTVNNHEKFYGTALKCYRGVLIAVLSIGVIGLFQTRESVIRHDIELVNIKDELISIQSTLLSIEARQYNMQSRDFFRSEDNR